MPTLPGTISWRQIFRKRCVVHIVFSIWFILMSGFAMSQNVIFEADFEDNVGDNNWTMLGGASDGDWIVGTPSPYTTGGIQMEIISFEGTRDLVTGQNFGQDVDGGPTRATSPTISLPTGVIEIDFEYYFSYYTNSSRSDHLIVDIRRASDGGLLQRLLRERGNSSGKDAAWTHFSADISAFAGQDIYIRVQSRDQSNGSKVEAALDLVTISTASVNSIDGFVFEDTDLDGVFDSGEVGIPNTTVTLFTYSGQVAQVISAGDGSYSFSQLDTTKTYQIMFSNWPTELVESVHGQDNNGSIQSNLLIGGQINFGLYSPSTYCADRSIIFVPCYVEGVYNASISNDAAIVKIPASAEGHHYNGTTKTAGYEGTTNVTYGDVGTVYGIAIQENHNQYYAGAFHKRYTSFGSGGPDAIYQIDYDGNVKGTISLDNLLGITNSTGGDVHDLTVSGNGEIFDLGTNDISFDAAGKRGFGDLDISDDFNILYLINLFDRRIYALDVTTGLVGDITITTSWDAPDATGASRHRPFGLAWHDGLLWIGSVDDNGQNGFVHSLDTQTGTFNLKLTIPLQFPRQSFFGDADETNITPAQWNAWETNTNFSYFDNGAEIGYPQPIISDIEFANNGDMIIGFRDRFGDQSGADKFFNASEANRTWAIAHGDILKACSIGTNFVLETGINGACPVNNSSLDNSGPGGVEFYYWDLYDTGTNPWDPTINTGGFHWETTQGGLIQLDNTPYVITTALDPIDDFSGGILSLDNTTGARKGVTGPTNAANLTGGFTVYEGGDFNNGLPPNIGLAAKSNGLGDLEADCIGTIIIGNYVWFDADQDGLQDPSEQGLAGVAVDLYKDNVLFGQTTTDSLGYYFFGGIENHGLLSGQSIIASTDYEIRIALVSAQTNDGSVITIGGLTQTDANSNTDDLLDSDAKGNGIIATILITTGSTETTNYSFDFGYTDCGIVSINNNFDRCMGDGFMVTVGSSLYNETNPTGIDSLLTQSGCDSIVNTTIIFHQSETEVISHEGCQGDGYNIVIGGITYNQANPSDTLTLASMHGCDSIVVIDLTFSPTYIDSVSYNGCEGDGFSMTVGTSIYDQNNPSGSDTLSSVLGCDSIIYVNLVFAPTSGLTGYLQDTSICTPTTITIDGRPPTYMDVIISSQWTALGSGTAMGYNLSNTSSETVTINANIPLSGTIILEYIGTTPTCEIRDTVTIQLMSQPICLILTDQDTFCDTTNLTLSAFSQYLVTPDSGMVISAPSGSGFTQDHSIIGVQDPASVKVIITLPTWDDHFDTIFLNGAMVIPEIFETASYNANGMNCVTPWLPNVNGLPRSILELSGDEVKYYSTLTTTSTSMTEVFPTNWATTPQPFVEGTNVLQFGIQNTNGPVSGSWFIEAVGTIGYSYVWNTGATSESITTNPTTTTIYQLTVTSPSGCQSTCDKTIYIGDDIAEDITYVGCSGDGYSIEVNGTTYNEANPIDTVHLITSLGCDSMIMINLTFDPAVFVEAGNSAGPICSADVVTLNDLGPSIAGGVNTGTWTSIGGGIFNNGGRFGGANPATTYQPSQSEMDQGIIILTLTSNDPSGPCEPEADAVMILINDIRCAQFPWAGGGG